MVIPLLMRIVSAAEVHVLMSAATPPCVVSMLSGLSSFFDQFTTFTPDESINYYQDAVFLDYIYNQTLSASLLSALGSSHRYLNMWDRNNNSLKSRQLQRYVTHFSNYIALANFAEVVLISDTQNFNLQATAYSIDNFSSQYRQRVVIPSDADEAFCHQFVARTIKPRGIRYIALFTSTVMTTHLLSALRALKMDKEGYAVVLSEEASSYRYANSAASLQHSQVLAVAEKPAEAESLLAVHRLTLLDLLQRLNSTGGTFLPTPEYNLYTVAGYRLQLLALGAQESLYSVDESLQQVVPSPFKSSKIPIDISVNYQFVEPNGKEYSRNSTIMRGIQVAVDEVNTKHDLIPDYDIRDNSVGFAGVIFDFNVARQRVIENREAVGLIYMSLPFSQAVQGMHEVFQSLNMTVPITASCIGSSLSSKEKYPLFVRPLPKNAYILKVMCRAITSFGWKRLAVLYQQDSGDCEEAYVLFQQLAAEYHLNITNSERNRALRYSPGSTSSEAANNSFAEILNSDSQVVLLISITPSIELQRMYDAGFRDGHAILMLVGLSDNFYTGPQFYRQRVVSKGAFMFFSHLFAGEVGKRVLKQLILYDNVAYFSTTCLFYDAAMLYFHATDFLLERGRDFEDPHLIVETMRKTRFQGCSGVVQIDPDSNDRASGEIAISNFHYDSDSDTYEIKVVGSYNPYISEPLHIQWDEIQWPNGESSFSDYKPKYCDYLTRNVSSSSIGKVTGAASCFGLVIIACAAGCCFWKGKLRYKVQMITQKFYVSRSDIFTLIAVAIEFMALASVGPSTAQIRVALHGAFALFFAEVLETESEVYWQRYYCVLCTSVWWVVLRLLRRCKSPQFLESFMSINDFFTPFVTRGCFVLFTVPLLQMFACSKGISKELGDSILDADCHIMCWSKDHSAFAMVSAIVFIAFSVEVAAYELSFQEERQDSHIRINPLAAAAKHALRLVLVASYASLRYHSPDLHAYIHLAGVSLYFTITVVLTETNYARLNLWSSAVHCAVVLQSVTAFTSQKVAQPTASVLAYILLAIYGLMLVGVCVVQWRVPKYESKLVRRKGLDIRHLLEFGFTIGKRAETALKKHYTEKSLHTDANQHFELEI